MTLAFSPNTFGNGPMPLVATIAYSCNSPVTKAIVKEVMLCNTAGVRANVYLLAVATGANAVQANSALLNGQPMDPNTTLTVALSTVLNQGDTLQHWASVAGVAFRYSGVEGQ